MPGAFELPVIAQKMAENDKYDAVICVGAVIRDATTHYDLVANESTKGIAQIGLKTGKPVLFGVITTENIEQATIPLSAGTWTTISRMQRSSPTTCSAGR